MHLLCKLIAAMPGEKRKHMAGQHNAADHGADHAQENQPCQCCLHDAQGSVAPPRNSLDPSVVQNMVTSVGGTICVESKAGEGTTFVIEIPQSGPEVEADGRKRLKHVQKIAIVSSEESAKTWKAAASHSRKTVDLYAHPAALIDRVQKDPSAYDLLIAEYTLPTMNGIELCEVVRRINPEIRLILIAEQGGADFEWYLNNGMIDRFMLKDEFAEEFAEMFEG